MKILYTASVLSHICQFHLPVMEELKKKGHIVHVAANDNLAEKNGLQLHYCDCFIKMPFQRSPRSKKNVVAYRKLKELLSEEHYDIVICNTPVVGVLTRLAAKESRKKGTKVVYIAHGFHFYKGAPKKYWAIYPVEKMLADFYTDLLITINWEDYKRAKKSFKCCVEHINGVGVKTERYHPVPYETQRLMRKNERLSENDFVILCTKELMFDNNQKTILRAVARLQNSIDNMGLLLAGNGPDENMLRNMTDELGITKLVRFLGYRTDLEKVVPAVNLVVSCSYREGMPLNIIEAMLCQRPIIASHNRGHDELIKNGKSGYLFNMLDDRRLAELILDIWRNPQKAEEMGNQAYDIAQKYTAETVVHQMTEIINKIERGQIK